MNEVTASLLSPSPSSPNIIIIIIIIIPWWHRSTCGSEGSDQHPLWLSSYICDCGGDDNDDDNDDNVKYDDDDDDDDSYE